MPFCVLIAQEEGMLARLRLHLQPAFLPNIGAGTAAQHAAHLACGEKTKGVPSANRAGGRQGRHPCLAVVQRRRQPPGRLLSFLPQKYLPWQGAIDYGRASQISHGQFNETLYIQFGVAFHAVDAGNGHAHRRFSPKPVDVGVKTQSSIQKPLQAGISSQQIRGGRYYISVRLAQGLQHQGKIVVLGAFLLAEQALVAGLAGADIHIRQPDEF